LWRKVEVVGFPAGPIIPAIGGPMRAASGNNVRRYGNAATRDKMSAHLQEFLEAPDCQKTDKWRYRFALRSLIGG
jgi:hypothetical protein